MPTSTILLLTPAANVTLPATMGHLAHAAFLNLIQQVDASLAQKLHERQRNVPFTCSRLMQEERGEREKEGRRTSLRLSHSPALHFPAGRSCWIRYTILDDSLLEVFSRRFLEQGELSLRLGSGTFQVRQLRTLEDAEENSSWSRWTGYASYEELWERAEPGRRWTFHFVSPTAFRAREDSPTRRRGDAERPGQPDTWTQEEGSLQKIARSITFPEPRRCFQSWLSRWNEFSTHPFDRDPLLDFVERSVVVLEHHVQTRMMQFPRLKMAGFVGEATFEAVETTDGEKLRQLDALATFAFFAGTGYGTPKGMGQTRRGRSRKEKYVHDPLSAPF